MESETKDDAAMQAECIVRAIDNYMTWKAAKDHEQATTARKRLVDTLAATIRMSEPRVKDLRRGALIKD